MRRNYRKPPIVEAVCEFRFRSTREWDWTIPGLIYDRIKSEFPEKRQQKSFEVSIAPVEGKITEVGGGLSKMQFLRSDGSAMVQLGPDLLAINVYPPYPQWENFEALINNHLALYAGIAEPAGVKRIGLRYINKITFQEPTIEMTDYFELYPRLPRAVPQEHGTFTMRIMQAYEGGRDTLNLRMRDVKSNTGTTSILLDLDYFLAQPEFDLKEGMAWIPVAHQNLEGMFEACITDKTREMFEEIR